MKKSLLITCFIILSFVSLKAQQKGENLKIVWPEEYKWKVGSNQENEQMHLMELVPGNETVKKWSIMGTMLSIKGATNVPMDAAMNMMFDQAKQAAPKAKLTFIEKDEKSEHPWILFKIEAPSFKNDKTPESQLYYVTQGSSSLYSNFVALKEATLSQDFVDKWIKIFKNSEFVSL